MARREETQLRQYSDSTLRWFLRRQESLPVPLRDADVMATVRAELARR